MRARTLTLEQARQVARHATPEDVAARIADAAPKPVITVRREAEAEDERQMWVPRLRPASRAYARDGTGPSDRSVPERDAQLFRDALAAGRHHFPGLTPGEIVVCIAAHFIFTWKPEVDRILRATNKVILRDGWMCQIPGCSREAEHLHHLWFRSQGGPDARWNLLGLCIPHHLFGVHQGHIEITGRAPDGLTFVVGEVAVRRARELRNQVPRGRAA